METARVPARTARQTAMAVTEAAAITTVGNRVGAAGVGVGVVGTGAVGLVPAGWFRRVWFK